MRKKGKNQNKPEKAGAWLATFTDLVCLMLTFFVLLFSMADTNKPKWDAMKSALAVQFDILDKYKDNTLINAEDRRSVELPGPGKSPFYISGQLKAEFDTLFDNIGVQQVHQIDRLLISIPGQFMFGAGQAELLPGGQEAVLTIARAVSKYPNQIEIYGHTDPDPPNRGRWVSNWELSLARARSVAKVFYDIGYERSIIIQGMADSQFDYLYPDKMLEERKQAARRVDIIIRYHKSKPIDEVALSEPIGEVPQE